MALMMIMMMIITNYAAYTPLQGITFIVMLMHSPTETRKQSKEEKEKEREQRPLRQTFEFMHFVCEVKSSMLSIKCILQMDLNAHVREDFIWI